MSVEDRVLRLENGFATLSELAAASEARTDMVVTLLRRMDERMDQHLAWINQLGAAQANTEAKLAALTDAQIKTEAKLAALTDAQVKTEQAFAAFQANTERALAKLAENIAGLVEAQARTDRRVDALIDIVGERPDGQQG